MFVELLFVSVCESAVFLLISDRRCLQLGIMPVTV